MKTYRNMLKWMGLALGMLSLQAPASRANNTCDTVALKNGSQIYGTVIQETADQVLFQYCGSDATSQVWIKRNDLREFPAMKPVEDTNDRLSLSGPRMGVVFFTGNIATRIQDPKSRGGLNAKPVMSQFGYQFETAYISSDKVQVLFEFVPNVTGLDQGKFIPTISVLNGVRLNKSGWEIIAGPIVYFTKRAEGFFDPLHNNEWTLLSTWRALHPGEGDPDNVIKSLDTRGDVGITTSFLFAVGKNFRAGKINFPVNLFAIPHQEGFRYGISVGFNKAD